MVKVPDMGETRKWARNLRSREVLMVSPGQSQAKKLLLVLYKKNEKIENGG